MSDFYLTRMGSKFYQSDVPRIANALEEIAKELHILNERQKPADESNGPH